MFSTIRPISSLFPLMVTALLVFGLALPACAETFQLQAVARPSRVVFGGDNRVTVDVTVRTAGSQPAPDGTPVYFNSTLGTLPTVAYTQQGKVSVLLDNEVSIGIAKVTVTVGDSREVITVEYLGKDGKSAAPTKSRRLIYRLDAKQVYYSVDKRVFDLRDDASFVTPDFTLTASAIQFDVANNSLYAQDGITITAGTTKLTALKLRMTLGNPTGSVITAEPDISYKTFMLPQLEAKEEESVKEIDFRPLSPLPTRTWILCAKATVIPHEQIQFRRPQFYLDSFDRKIYGLPYHVLDLRNMSGGMFFNSQISVTSDAGLDIDFPIYFDASDSHIGSIHLRGVAKGTSAYSGSSGFQVGVQEEYLLGDYADGGIYLDDLTNDTRSFTWEHSHDIGSTFLDLNAAYERYSDDTPYTTRLGIGASRNFGEVRTRFSTNWSEFNGSQDGLAELALQLPDLELGKTGFNLSFDPYLGIERSVYAATDELPKETFSNFYQGMRTGLGVPTVSLLGGTLSTSISDDIAHEQDGTLTNYLDASVSYRRPVARVFNTSLSYSYSLASSNNDDLETEPNQRVSLDFSGRGGTNWNLYGYSNYSFNTKQFYHSLHGTYYLPWFRKNKNVPRCYLGYRASITTGEDTSTVADQLFSLGWNFGSYGLVARYSPTGNNAVTGIGTGTGKRWAIELVRQGW
ncbi:MAG: LPS-assembly protein LptD [Armatimonadota bacterium]